MAERISEEDALRQALLGETGTLAEDTPSDEELLAYLEGKLEGEAEERLQDHLAAHPETTQRLLDLQGFLQGPPANRQPRCGI